MGVPRGGYSDSNRGVQAVIGGHTTMAAGCIEADSLPYPDQLQRGDTPDADMAGPLALVKRGSTNWCLAVQSLFDRYRVSSNNYDSSNYMGVAGADP